MTILSIDPGSKKCGLSVVDGDLSIKELSIVDTNNIEDAILSLLKKYEDINIVLIGNKTSSVEVESRIKEIVFQKGLKLTRVEEKFSTQEGKEEFIRRRGFWRALFKNNFDEWASFILVKRFLKGRKDNG